MKDRLKIICLMKIIPDVGKFSYDYERNILVRDNVKSILNPDDACALAAALNVKKRTGAEVTVVSMGPPSIRCYLEDLVRRGADRAALITDALYAGSDTYVTAKILARCIKRYAYDMVFSGTRSLDGDTSHIPCQVAELMDLNIMSDIVRIHEDTLSEGKIQFQVKEEKKRITFSMTYPAVLGISSESKYKLPFVKYDDLEKDVSDDIDVITNNELCFLSEEVGLKGSKTKVVKTYPRQSGGINQVVVHNDEIGIEYVYNFLKEKGFV